jgi:hypothetical protein
VREEDRRAFSQSAAAVANIAVQVFWTRPPTYIGGAKVSGDLKEFPGENLPEKVEGVSEQWWEEAKEKTLQELDTATNIALKRANLIGAYK